MIPQVFEFLSAHPLTLATIKILIVFGVVSGMVAYLVLAERKVLAFMQARLGPMRVGPWGLLQPVADGLKLLLKEDIIPDGADKAIFWLAPVISVAAAFTVFAAIPFGPKEKGLIISDLNIGLLFILGVSSLGIYGIILGGWSSNSHYPLLGALRSSAQLVSYEVAGGMAIIGVLLISNSLSMVDIVTRQRDMHVWNIFLQPIAFFIYLVAAVAETNRNPFDLPEAESELTAGFHTEYSGFRFSLYFLAEYTNMIVVSAVAVTLFWGGWLQPFRAEWTILGFTVPALSFLKYAPVAALGVGAPFWIWYRGSLKSTLASERFAGWLAGAVCVVLGMAMAFQPVLDAIQPVFWFVAKIFVFLYAFIWYRATFPRYRYDQLMDIGWRFMIPLALGNVILTAVLRYGLSRPHAVTAWLMGGR